MHQSILQTLIDLLFAGAGLTASAVVAASLLRAFPAWRALSLLMKDQTT